ncbi:hypothetical protein [Pseudophaeobacter sp.]|uniref:hypothetical protein n=1 Tax=Pseudophaeobacter sp. TaxID=1971739 RepID=UPI0032975C64
MFAFLCATLLTFAASERVYAQTVSVQNGLGEYGFGWMFNRNGTCYVVMPKHVAGPFPAVTIFTSAPVQHTSATVIAPFWPEIDLALGVARGGIAERCTAKLDDLVIRKTDLAHHTADLLRLSPTGEINRNQIEVRDRTYLEFTGRITDESSDIGQGTSGAFAFVKGRPVGMAITSDDPNQARFIRSGEILIHIRRFLDEQGGVYSPPVMDETTEHQNESGHSDALPLRFISSTVAPINPMHAPENLTSDGRFIFESSSLMSLVFGFEKTLQVSRILAVGQPSNQQTIPKTLLLRTSVDPDGKRFSSWMRAEMGPDGVLDTGALQPRNMRFLELRILDTWGSGDVVLNNVTAY